MNSYFKFGAVWEQRDIDWLLRFFAHNELDSSSLAAAGFALGRRPDSIVSKMVKEGHWKTTMTGVTDGKKTISDSVLEWFRRNDFETVSRKCDWKLSPTEVAAYYCERPDIGADAPPPPPDDRILYVCHDGTTVTAASFKWADVADIGVTEKRVVDLSEEAASIWGTLLPDVQAILRAAIKEGKV